jgi:hypothetical protein
MALEDRALSDRVFEKAFESRWQEFESSLLLAQSEEKTPQAPQRKDHEILEEILGLVRDQARRNPGALTIQSAKYGSRGQYVDVTQILAERVSGGHLEVYAGNQLAGDPSPGDTKELVVEYI